MPEETDDTDKYKFNFRSALIVAVAVIAILLILRYFGSSSNIVIPYSQLVRAVKEKPDIFKNILITEGPSIEVTGFYIDENKNNERAGQPPPARIFSSVVPRASYQEFIRLLDEKAVTYNVEAASGGWSGWIYWIAVIFFWLWVFRSMKGGALNSGGGGGFFSFLRSRPRLSGPNAENPVTFADVAGIDEAKEELSEIVDFLKKPQYFSRLGGKIPKGVLLMGQPGTGKTLLARAVAGEAGVPFLSMGGSDFMEMFVGVGASRMRDLFEKAKKFAPCIIFIDEIDSVGRSRGATIMGHDEHGQTLNQLLSEMDGFETNQGVIVMAATNRPDVLDHALLRPGRFDRRVVVPMPDLEGRLAILKVHARRVLLAPSVNLKNIAQGTIGFSGADLANLINEAALKAARDEKENIEEQDLEAAKEKVLVGPERKTARVSAEERMTIAFHEAGHAVVARALPNADPPHKVSIVPRGLAAGLTWQLPKEDRSIETKTRLEARLAVLMAGRAAEEIGIGNETISTGAGNDLERATDIARNMVCRWAMGKLGPRVFGEKNESVFLGIGAENRNYSEDAARRIDDEIRYILEEQMEKARKILSDNSSVLRALADKLLAVETVDRSGLEDFFNAHPITNRPEEPIR